ncbi:efflux transporter outer membrane subunit [Alkalilimnicola sp. S0819]|uniref:efflux transporter outer membrane subunit n=1 Tax=Alkalilimnicola sp. S0819 TaxID=2613922 RepID=UPI00186A8CD4|nr:efflux transporter outer membrane subunit [Alkalilimnicola sp. S0819]
MILSGLLALSLAGCAAVPERQNAMEIAPLPEQFSASGDQPLPDRWWRHFDSAELDRLVESALEENFTLAAARARLQRAAALARRAGSNRYPSLELSGGARRENSRRADAERHWSAGLAAGYEIDLWGRVAADTDAAEMDAGASAAALRSAAISLSAEVADSWMQWLQARELAALLEQQRRVNGQVLEIVDLRYRNGAASADEVLRQRQLAAQTEAAIVEQASKGSLLRQRLAVLVGRLPGELQLSEPASAPTAPDLPATGLPADWLQRRPDLRQAWYELAAADARLASAVAAQYPRFSLSASLAYGAPSLSGLFDNWLAGIAANLAVPLLDGGRLRADVDAAAAARAVAFNDYAQALLEAVAEVEAALEMEQRDRRLLENLQQRRRRADHIVEQLRYRYINGSAQYLEVLNALESQQQVDRALIQGRWRVLRNRITLARSLAGGWPQDLEHD